MAQSMRALIMPLAVLASACPGFGLTAANEPEKGSAEANPFAPLERFVGGQWVTHGRWASGEELHARAVFEWGIARKIITAKVYVKNGASEYQRYEEVLAWHPKKKCLFEMTFAFDGHISETVIEKEGEGLRFGWTPYDSTEENKVRQTIRFQGKDSYVWTVFLKGKDGWKQIIQSIWNREEK
jgi:hypothetical protein